MLEKLSCICLALMLLNSCALAPKVRGSALGNLDCLDLDPSHIIEGRPVSVEEPLAKEAVLLIIQRASKTTSCTGVPVSERLVLTAAHCVSGAPQDGIGVVFHTDMKCRSGYRREKSIPSISYSIHQDFDGTPQARADLAVVKLARPIPAEYSIGALYDGKTKLSSDDVVMLGYGITDESLHDSMELRTAIKSFKRDAYVKEGLIGFRQDGASGGFCRGDSGAPIYVNTGGVKKIIGINSFNIGTAKNNECHTASAAMYVPYFSLWIKNQILEL